MAAHEPQPEFRRDEPLLRETPVLRLSIGPSPARGISVAVRVDAEWRTIATAGWAQLVVVDGDSSPDAQRRTLDLAPSSLARADAGALMLAGALDDVTLGRVAMSSRGRLRAHQARAARRRDCQVCRESVV
jgi:hypothetical protein